MSGHPYLDHPSRWCTSLPVALQLAEDRRHAVMLVIGPERCVATRSFIEKSLCKDEVVEMLDAGFTPLAIASLEEPTIRDLVATLPKREPTPVTLYLSPHGALLLSTVGGRPPAVVMNDMMQAAHKLRQAVSPVSS